jgi:hypothetical protein
MVTIGVTGHRILTELDKVNAGVEDALRRIAQTFPGTPWTVVSALAEGADRVVVQCVLAHRPTRLVVPLPLPVSDYLAACASPESRHEFLTLLAQTDEVIELPPAPTRDAAYEEAGLYVLEHCEVLLAIWDGQGAQGQGGTGAIVAQARQRGLPLAWVHAGNRKPGTREPTSLGAEQGKVTFENFSPATMMCDLNRTCEAAEGEVL